MAMVSGSSEAGSAEKLFGPGSSQSSRGGAQFALQVALQTMKERCQQLQRRLTTLEDENIALRRIVARSGIEDRSGTQSTQDNLREQVAVLSLQKAQLSQQMQMVAAENRQLWLRLSRLNQANQSMGSHLSRISDTLRQHSTANTTSSPTPSDTPEVDSLEEISLKLANSIIQEKLDLEQQCAQMAELHQHDSISFDLGTLAAQGDGTELLAEHCARLQEVRDALRGQQAALRAGVETLRQVQDRQQEPPPPPRVAPLATTELSAAALGHGGDPEDEEESRQLASLRQWAEPPPDWTCPMCGSHFQPSSTLTFEHFHAHVMQHFLSEGEELDEALINSFDILN